MNLKIHKPILILFLVSIVFYLIHKTVFYIFKNELNSADFIYSLETLYTIFLFFSAIIVFVLLKIKQKNINNVGMVFLVMTSIKMVICYFLLYPIASKSLVRISIEKTNFFVMFILFLAIETIVTIRVLNNKQ